MAFRCRVWVKARLKRAHECGHVLFALLCPQPSISQPSPSPGTGSSRDGTAASPELLAGSSRGVLIRHLLQLNASLRARLHVCEVPFQENEGASVCRSVHRCGSHGLMESMRPKLPGACGPLLLWSPASMNAFFRLCGYCVKAGLGAA